MSTEEWNRPLEGLTQIDAVCITNVKIVLEDVVVMRDVS